MGIEWGQLAWDGLGIKIKGEATKIEKKPNPALPPLLKGARFLDGEEKF